MQKQCPETSQVKIRSDCFRRTGGWISICLWLGWVTSSDSWWRCVWARTFQEGPSRAAQLSSVFTLSSSSQAGGNELCLYGCKSLIPFLQRTPVWPQGDVPLYISLSQGVQRQLCEQPCGSWWNTVSVLLRMVCPGLSSGWPGHVTECVEGNGLHWVCRARILGLWDNCGMKHTCWQAWPRVNTVIYLPGLRWCGSDCLNAAERKFLCAFHRVLKNCWDVWGCQYAA